MASGPAVWRIGIALVALTLGCAGTASSRPSSTHNTNDMPTLDEHQDWVTRSLRHMESITVGMTRRQMREVFVTEGGLLTGRTFVYKDCPYFKVDFEFTYARSPVHDADGRVTQDESPDDVIATRSRPYLQLPIAD